MRYIFSSEIVWLVFLEFILYETIHEYLEKIKTSDNDFHRKMIEERFTVSVKIGY